MMGADIVERLRDINPWHQMDWPETVREAATEIETLRARVGELEGALRPFADYMKDGGDLDNIGNPLPDEQGVGWVYLTIGDFRRARTLSKGAAS